MWLVDVAAYSAPRLSDVLTLGSFQSPRAGRGRAFSATSTLEIVHAVMQLNSKMDPQTVVWLHTSGSLKNRLGGGICLTSKPT